MSTEFYTHLPAAPNCASRPEPQRAGELLPELFRRYVKRMAAANARPAALVEETAAPKLGISIVVVQSPSTMVVPNAWSAAILES